MNRVLDLVKKLPKTSGIYLFKDKKGRVLYIGKAVNLKNRLRAHWQRPQPWFSQIAKIETKKTGSEIEALILEAQLIKKCRPKYNIQWKDDKNYFYVGITKEAWPRLFIAHQIKQNKQLPHEIAASPVLSERFRKGQGPRNDSQYIGPFVDGQALKSTLQILRKIFPYRSCRVLPKRPCLQYHLTRCLAPCKFKVKSSKLKVKNQQSKNVKELRKESLKNIASLIKLLKGKKGAVLKKLKQEMQKASQKQNFEKAAKIREQIRGLKKVLAHSQVITPALPSMAKNNQTAGLRSLSRATARDLAIGASRNDDLEQIFSQRIEAYDVSNISGQEATGSMVVFEKGKPKKSDYRRFKIKTVQGANDVAMIQEVLRRRLQHHEWPWPKIILIDGGKPQLNASRQTIKKLWPLTKCRPLLLGVAKKQEILYTENKRQPLPLKNLPQGLGFLIQRVRDEAHRFAIKYHRALRRKSLLH